MLHLTRYDPPPDTAPDTAPATPLLIAHGLFGSARNWGVIARRLAESRPVIAVDMRNHGSSPWFATHTYADMAADLAQVLVADGPADVLGHSMGGKAAMVLALSRPDLVRRLIVADIAPVGYGHSQMPQIAAMRRVDLARVTSRAEAAAMLRAESPDIAAFLLQSLDLDARAWRLNLDVIEAAMPGIIGFPPVSGQFTGPALFVSGAQSSYLRPAHHGIIAALFPQAQFQVIPDTGHWLHAEKPREFVAAVQGFLA